ncbi:serine-rich glycoprotein adhesin [uncultured Limosilactobacillus sp.]|uniref:serine-rich glycoprotein adhesin n=2 Tax=uncultured Limosilactobacillus sp. TaxID=2837629 RepID=UPI00272DC74D|nr:serine-rich glycoprotein adhesin [uncultured Limosilactobacillus sp.]
MSKHKNEQENGSKVKLYKTKHGWFSALTRFFKLFSFRSKKEVKPTNFNDLDSIKDKHDDVPDAYKKGAATMATLLGAGVVGTSNPTEAHAATTTVDQSSQVVGSGSTSTSTSTSQTTGSTSTSTSTTSGSASTTASTANSTSTSTSTTTSTSGSSSTSQSTTGSASTSTSTSASTSTASQSGSTSTSTSTSGMTSLTTTTGSLAGGNNNTDDNAATVIPTEEAQTSVAQSLLTQNTVNNTTTAATAMLYNTNLIQLRAANGNSITVNNSVDFNNALNNNNISEINLAGDVTTSTGATITNRDLTINGNGNKIYVDNDGSRTIINNGSVTVNNAIIYNANVHGAFDLETSVGPATLTYNNVTAYGGTAVFTDTTTANQKTFEVQGNTTINYVTSYTNQSNNTVNTTTFTVNSAGSSQVYVGGKVIVHDGANFTVNGSDGTNRINNNIEIKGNLTDHGLIIGQNATVNLNGADRGNVLIDQIISTGNQNTVTVGENSKVDMEAGHVNILINNRGPKNITFASNSQVNLKVNHSLDSANNIYVGDGNIVTYSSNTYYNAASRGATNAAQNSNSYVTNITFAQGSSATLTVDNVNSNNIASADRINVNITDPRIVTLNNTGGNAYSTLKNATGVIANQAAYDGLSYTTNNFNVNVNNSSVRVVNNGNVEQSDYMASNVDAVTGDRLTTDAGNMVMINGDSTAQQNAVDITNKISDDGTTQVVYNSWSIPSASTSTSESIVISQSTSTEQSISESQQVSQSVSHSISGYTSASVSESLSNSTSKSGSISESESNSASVSESLSNSASMSDSLSNSASMSDSLSNSASMSESLSNSASMSESMSNSVSMSESLSNSVSMSESLSNSVSMSESLSNSVSMSESLSNSVSMSESMSNSVSMSESLSNSVSMSESLSNSVSMSESLSNSVSMSESLSNSVSMSESLSNSVSMSESLSNSVSMSESMSNSVSMSESLSNSVSMSESLSNSVSMSESLSNSVSMSESLSN